MGQFGGRDVLQGPLLVFKGLGNGVDIHGVDEAEADVGVDVHAPCFVHEALAVVGRTAGVGGEAEVSAQAPDPGGGLEFDVDALGAVLKIPAALGVGFVVAGNEVDEFAVCEQRAFGSGASAGEAALGLGRVVAHVPLAAFVQAEPAVAVGDVGPFAHGLLNDVIHGVCVS